jgi:hypothetical protein
MTRSAGTALLGVVVAAAAGLIAVLLLTEYSSWWLWLLLGLVVVIGAGLGLVIIVKRRRSDAAHWADVQAAASADVECIERDYRYWSSSSESDSSRRARGMSGDEPGD